jgi:cell division protein FtsA
MDGVPELAEALFDLPVRRGVPESVGGRTDLVKSPMHATGVGLALWGARHGAPSAIREGASGGGVVARAARRIAGWFGEIL